MGKLRIAVATNEKKGLEDSVSNVFGRAKTYTIVDTQDEKVINVKILENPAVSYHHGAGPIVVKMLIDEGVKLVLANELGFGASELLKQHKVEFVQTKPGTIAENAITKAIQANKLLINKSQ